LKTGQHFAPFLATSFLHMDRKGTQTLQRDDRRTGDSFKQTWMWANFR